MLSLLPMRPCPHVTIRAFMWRLEMSGADIGMLASIVRGMEKACAHNPRGMSESECLSQLHQREDVCNTTIARRFPGKISDTGRLEAIALAYRDCIFEE